MKGILHKRQSAHENLRTDSVAGYFNRYPEIGQHFTIIGFALDPDKNIRVVTTSAVKNVTGEHFETQNSMYRLEVLDDSFN